MQRSSRRNKILEIVGNRQIETQEEIAEALFAEGYKVTQATVSRDIKEMGLIKISDLSGRQFYAKDANGRGDLGKIADIAQSAITGSEARDNLVVVKTLDGFGRVAKEAIRHLCENFGCVADDDTVFVAFRDSEAAESFVKKLNAIIY